MSSYILILIASFFLLLVGSVLSILGNHKVSNKLYAGILLVASASGLAGACLSWQVPQTWSLPDKIFLGVAPVSFHADALSAVFLLLLFIVSFSVALFSPGYLKHLKPHISLSAFWASLFIFIFAMGGVVLSANALTFLVFWEGMSISSAVLVALDFKRIKSGRAALIYLGATRIASALLAAGFILFYLNSGSWSFSEWNTTSPETLVPAFLVLIGLCIKCGLWPFHIWLPYAHPAAPSPVSALMSGVMIKVALYAIIRLFATGVMPSSVIAIALLCLGLISSLWGALFALVQYDLKRLLAYSSVENIGLMAVGVSISMYAMSKGWNQVAVIGFVAALFHALNHGFFKSLLFLCAGSIDYSVQTRDLDQLGGLARNMPVTMLCFLVGSAAISALPPLNGFSSKWLIYQSLFNFATHSKNELESAMALACIGALALVGGLAVACFTNATAMSFLGRARTNAALKAREVTAPMTGGLLLLALPCVFLGIASPWAINMLRQIYPFTEKAVPTLPMATVFMGLLVFAFLLYFLFMRKKVAVRKTWECGYGSLGPHMQISAESFAQPIASIFKPVLAYRLRSEIAGADRRHFPEKITADATMQSLLESRIYGPIIMTVRRFSDHLARLQAGSVHLYLLYILVTLVILLLLGSRL